MFMWKRAEKCKDHTNETMTMNSTPLTILILHFRFSGNIDVEVLEGTENIISAYSLSNEARSFAATITTSQPRMKWVRLIYYAAHEIKFYVVIYDWKAEVKWPTASKFMEHIFTCLSSPSTINISFEFHHTHSASSLHFSFTVLLLSHRRNLVVHAWNSLNALLDLEIKLAQRSAGLQLCFFKNGFCS